MDNVTVLVRLMVHLKVIFHNGSRVEKMMWPCSVQASEHELSLHMTLQPPQRQLQQQGVKEGWGWSCCCLCYPLW